MHVGKTRRQSIACPVALFAVCAGCIPAIQGPTLHEPSTGEAFGGVSCSAARPPTEPDLMAWDPGSRANVNRLRERGLVAVRYTAKGCNVELELVSNCIGRGTYEYSPYSANEHKVAHNANELFAQLPLGAASLVGRLKGNRTLRTDYMLVGVESLPPDASVKRSDLAGLDCARATHVINAIWVGGFRMEAGESRQLDAKVDIFKAEAGDTSAADLELLADEGNANACTAAQQSGEPSAQCAVPLRVGLLPIDGLPTCPPGLELSGDRCVAAVDTTCAAGMRFLPGHGCEPVDPGTPKWAFFATSIASIAVLGTGVGIAINAEGQQNQQTSLDPYARDPSIQKSVQRQATATDALFIGAGVLAAGAGVLAFTTHWKTEGSDQALSLTPWVGPATAGMGAHGDF
jgi:hypothetical protein